MNITHYRLSTNAFDLCFVNIAPVLCLCSPEKEKGLKKRAKLLPQENGEKSENGLSRETVERRENGDGDSDNEPEEVK